jgi:hypothetical protein
MPADVLARMQDAQNRHDLEAFLACFHADYRSEQPVHPDRDFVGVDQVAKNWAKVFADVPDFRSDLVRSASDGDSGWAEWHWHGTRPDGTRMDLRGVSIFGVRVDRIAWGRLYMDYVDTAGAGIDHAVEEMTRGDS